MDCKNYVSNRCFDGHYQKGLGWGHSLVTRGSRVYIAEWGLYQGVGETLFYGSLMRLSTRFRVSACLFRRGLPGDVIGGLLIQCQLYGIETPWRNECWPHSGSESVKTWCLRWTFGGDLYSYLDQSSQNADTCYGSGGYVACGIKQRNQRKRRGGGGVG